MTRISQGPVGRSTSAQAIADRLAEKAWLAIPVMAAVVAVIAFLRSHPGFGVENDFLGGFVPEAERILAGEPLLLQWHPPFYPLVLALTRLAVGDWFTAGLVVSVVSSVVAMTCGFLLFKKLLGPLAGAGALLGFAASGTFLELSATASSDVFFLSLFLASLLAALAAVEHPSAKRWILCGVLVGLGLLTRSNALTLVVLVAAPLLVDAPAARRLRLVLACAGGLALPLLVWGYVAMASGAPFAPRDNHVNLAMTYYASGDRVSSESRRQVVGRFDGLIDVVTHDPLRIALTYVKDGINLVQSGLPQLLAPPLNLFVGAGVVVLVIARHDPVILGLAVALLAQILLVNFKAFDDRFFLFLVPVFGAGLVLFAHLLTTWVADLHLRRVLAGGLALCAAIAIVLSVAQSVRRTQLNQAELREAVRAAKQVPAEASVVARKPHVAVMAGVNWIRLPNVASFNALSDAAREMDPGDPVYLYYGSIERATRPQFAALADPARAPAGFVVQARGSAGGGWALYRYVPAEAAASTRHESTTR